ncbi:MAG: COX15/CtaA family protein, partial [Bdellovibrionota bacterium]
YLHRLVGRLIGVLVLVQLVWLIVRRRISQRLAGYSMIGLGLGGLQGFLGGYMVKSGLVNEPRVSHYRLAAHLLLAVVCLTWFFALWLRTNPPKTSHQPAPVVPFRFALWALGILTLIQLFFGALVAGLRAGRIFNTFPKMGEGWLPPDFWVVVPAWENFFANAAVVQFIHRTLGIAIVAGLAVWAWAAWKQTHQRRVWVPLILAALQVVLGVVTLLLVVPVSLGVGHQILGILFFMTLVLSLQPS